MAKVVRPGGISVEPIVSTPSKSGAEFLVNTTTDGGQSLATITALPDGRFVAV
jgi:hypothetical protein